MLIAINKMAVAWRTRVSSANDQVCELGTVAVVVGECTTTRGWMPGWVVLLEDGTFAWIAKMWVRSLDEPADVGC